MFLENGWHRNVTIWEWTIKEEKEWERERGIQQEEEVMARENQFISYIKGVYFTMNKPLYIEQRS